MAHFRFKTRAFNLVNKARQSCLLIDIACPFDTMIVSQFEPRTTMIVESKDYSDDNWSPGNNWNES